jgi:glycosyltransferase involved in cell wall biosynthesis
MLYNLKHNRSCLTVIIPCYNEDKTVGSLIKSVLKQEIVGELIVIDDGSTDSSVKQIQKIKDRRIRLIQNKKNIGKGHAIALGIKQSKLPILVIQDADLEYNPLEYRKLARPILADLADVVYGSRYLPSDEKAVLYFWHKLGNNFLTLLSNLATNLTLTDMETCFKMMKSNFAKKIVIQENRFGIEPELTAKLVGLNARFYEVPISYHGRTYKEGKKITWKDGISAIFCILKYNRPKVRKYYKKLI